MDSRIASRVLLVNGLVLVLSGAVIAIFGYTQFFWIGVVAGVAAIAAGFALGERGGVKRLFTGRAAHYGFFTAVSALLVVALLGVANWAAYRRPWTWDLTRNRIFTLQEDTVRTLGGLKEDVQVLAFYGQADAAYPQAQDLLRRYAGRSPRFQFRFVDPYKAPEEVKRYAITEGGPRIVLLRGKEEARAREPSEEALTNALVKVTRSGPRRIYFTEGHGEPAPADASPKGYSVAVKQLESEGFEVAPLSLLEKADVPEDASAVLVAGARKPLLDPEVQALRRYAARGGHLGVFLEPEVNAGLDRFLEEYGIEADEDMVVDPSPVSRLFGGSAVTPIVRPSAAHEISRDLAQVGLAFPTTRSLVARTGAPVTPVPIALSGKEAWGETSIQSLYTTGAKHDEGEKSGPLPVAMAAEKASASEGAGKSRVVVVGDSDFFSNGYQQLLGNLDFFMNAASWLAEREDRITIRPKSREASRLFLSEAQVSILKLLTIGFLPIGLLEFGLAVWLVRRSR